MKQDEQLMNQLLEVFKDEAREHLLNAGRTLIELEKADPNDVATSEKLAETFRAMHSLKGAARVVNLVEIADTAHRVESVLNAARTGDLKLNSDHFDLLLGALDELENLINAALGGPVAANRDYTELHGRLEAALELKEIAEQPQVEAPTSWTAEEQSRIQTLPAPAPLQTPDDSTTQSALGDETIRVAAAKLDVLLAQTGELLTAKIGVEERAKETRLMVEVSEERAREARRVADGLQRLLEVSPSSEVEAVLEAAIGAAEGAFNLAEQLQSLAGELAQDKGRISLVTTDLQDEIRRLRMLPISQLFDPIPRMIRDLARRQDKKIDLQIGGADTEVDKRILEGIKDPLTHLLSNAVDHGIEDTATRLAKGKPETGTIVLSARMRGNELLVNIVDDGRGIDVNEVRDAAINRGLLRKDEVEMAPKEEHLNLIFRSGLSTAPEVTDVSGRGVGLDVVRENIERLGGRLEVKTQVGRGTTFRMLLPVTLATAEGLLLRLGNQTLAIPIAAIARILRVRRDDVYSVDGKPTILVEDEPIALIRLADLIEMPDTGGELKHSFPVILLSSVTKRVALVVDALIGHQEMVVKSLGKQLSRVRNVVGATVLGSGEVVVVLNPLDLLKAATNDRRSRVVSASWAEAESIQRKWVLVADDSITTRNLERMTLESAGYAVKTAADGQQAWRMLLSERFDLVVTDLQMPHLNGLDLIKRMKGNARTQSVPVILLTSMGSAEDIARGMEVGADGYIVKSAFDRETILQTVGQLV